jgi:hypothetical protein
MSRAESSMQPEPTFDGQLVDLHLGRLSASEQVELNLRIAADPTLQQQHETLATVFKALNSHKADPAPADLATRVAARVAASGRRVRLIRPVDDLTRTVERGTPVILRLGNMREIVAAAAMIVLMVGFAVPSLLHMRERGQRMACSANLAALGMGVQQYAQTFGSSLPFTGWNSRASWAPSQDPGVVVVPNRRHLYPLLRNAFIAHPRLFLCPSSGGAPMPADQVARRNDFLDDANLSYTYFNMAGQRPSVEDNPELPVMSDQNPVFGEGVSLLNRIAFRDRAELNSPSHAGAGQNILILDGHVKWVKTPDAGIDGDNIWTLQGVNAYTGREGPASAVDAHLIK